MRTLVLATMASVHGHDDLALAIEQHGGLASGDTLMAGQLAVGVDDNRCRRHHAIIGNRRG
jgi:hypothetical protein